MSYRTYIGYISTSKYMEIYNLTLEQFIELFDIECISDFNIFSNDLITELYNFGNDAHFDIVCDKNSKIMNPFFDNDDLQKAYTGDDIELNIVSKNFLKHVIENYHNKIIEFYNSMLFPFVKYGNQSEFYKSKKQEYDDKFNEIYDWDFSKITQNEKSALFKILSYNFSKSNEWVSGLNYDLENNKTEITNSWKYEYAIFELIRIYKTFDWDNNIMVFYGG